MPGSGTRSSAGSPSEEDLLRELAAAPTLRPEALDVTEAGELRGTERFTIERCLGRGGFGTVYEAHDRRRAARVALKVLHRADPRALYLFKQEFRAARDLHHPGLVQLYELFADGDRWYFTMELVDGRDVVEHLRAAGPPGVRETCDVMLDLCGALGALHAADKIHRDIKPQNALVTAEGRVVLLDFGLLHEIAPDGAAPSDIAGTPDYMSPEQAGGLPLTPASDLFSVGALLFEALTGERPFRGPTGAVMAQKQREDGPAPSTRVAGLPADLDDLCRDLLRRRPEDRPDLDEVTARLARIRGAHAGARPAPPAPHAPLIGREPHVAALRAAFDESGEGRAVAVLCAGSSGVGKSTLCRVFLGDLVREEPRAVVLSGRCFEHEQIPFKAVDGVVDALSRHLARLPHAEAAALLPRDAFALRRIFPVLEQVRAVRDAPERRVTGPQHLQRAAFGALRELLQRLADRRRLVLHVDDLQWSDLDSIGLLTEILRGPDAPPLLLCATCREEDAATAPLVSALRALGAEGSLVVRDLVVGELSPDEALAMARSLLPAAPDELARRVAEESRGNPFHLRGLAAHAEEGGVPTVEEAIARRVAGLSARARRLLSLVCLAGQPLARAVAHTALDAGAPDGGGARDGGGTRDGGGARDGGAPDASEPHTVAALRAERLLRARSTPAGEELVPYHDRVRESVVALLPAEIQRAHHLDLARALERGGAADEEPERLMKHYAEAGEIGLAARHAVAAAAKAHAALAFTRAAHLYEVVLASGALSAGEARALRPRLADAYAAAGRLRDAARAYQAAAADAQGEEAQGFARLAMEQLVLGRDLPAGMALARRQLADAGLHLPSSAWGLVLALLWARIRLALRGLRAVERAADEVPQALLSRIDLTAPLATTLGVLDPLRGAWLVTVHLLDALDAGERSRLANALGIEAYVRAVIGRHASAARLMARAEALCARGVTAEVEALTEMGAAGLRLEAGDFQTAAARLRAIGERLREQFPGKQWAADMARIGEIHALWTLGDLRALAQLLPELLRDAHDRGSLFLLSVARVAHGCVALCQGRPRAVEESLRALADRPEQEPLRDDTVELELLVFAALHAGRAADAAALVATRAPLLARSRLLAPQQQRLMIARLQATAALVAHDAAPAPARLREAHREARRLARERVPHATATAHLFAALAEKRAGAREEAAALLARAEDAFTAAGMRLYAACARLRRGELLGGSEGRALVADAERAMTAEGVVHPDRVAAMLAP